MPLDGLIVNENDPVANENGPIKTARIPSPLSAENKILGGWGVSDWGICLIITNLRIQRNL